MPIDFRELILAYLHDPPDKALDIRGHETRASVLASVGLQEVVSRESLHSATREEDVLASVAERIPLPSAGKSGERAVGVGEDGRIQVIHPLSGQTVQLSVKDTGRVDMRGVLEEILEGVDLPWDRFFLLWRYFSERLAAEDAAFLKLPADTRIPDHSIWNHLDIAAAWKGALTGNRGAAFLQFSLGPVQSFIAAARSLRDLWTGSYLLSWLTFQAMTPILESYGPTAFVYPALRRSPLLDQWLSTQPGLAGKIETPAPRKLSIPSLPNRFLAVIPWGDEGKDAKETADKCVAACKNAWNSVAKGVFEFLDSHLAPLNTDWANLWEQQVESFFETHTSLLPLRGCTDEKIGQLLAPDGKFESALPTAAAVRSLASAIPAGDRPNYPQGSAGRWAGQVEISAKCFAAARSVRHVPHLRAEAPVPQKCSILGTYEQMGPAGLEESNRFWEEVARAPFRGAGGARVRRRERLCAISLVKRFAWPVVLAKQLGLDPAERAFLDTATVAARFWLEEAGIDPDEARRKHHGWNGQWLHWTKRDQEPEDPVPEELWETIIEKRRSRVLGWPPAYYAVIQLDGDDMGRWLAGEIGPTVRESLHPKLRKYFDELGSPSVSEAMGSRRPVSPALHAAISEALSNFALQFVQDVVEGYKGTLIYAGGDDMLALLPLRYALSCAKKLRECFSSEWLRDTTGIEYLLMGSRASASAGISVVHHKEDLRLALQAARQAEEAAKRAGKDALALAVWRRSGEHAQAVMGWSFCERMQRWTDSFLRGASSRWIYKMREELEILGGLDVAAFKAEMCRLLRRTEEGTRGLFDEEDLKRDFDAYRSEMQARFEKTREGRHWTSREGEMRIRSDFVTLLQSAAFLARGRDV